ncbi:hypothetical protein XaC1_136 [Xanthomonas phage XaC1]|nr:hypothetical protein XaC1_136 [Xanthomonas phage XaC1]
MTRDKVREILYSANDLSWNLYPLQVKDTRINELFEYFNSICSTKFKPIKDPCEFDILYDLHISSSIEGLHEENEYDEYGMKIHDSYDSTKFFISWIDIKDDNVLHIMDQDENQHTFSIADDEFSILLVLSSISSVNISFQDLVTSCRETKKLELLISAEIRKEIDNTLLGAIKNYQKKLQK